MNSPDPLRQEINAALEFCSDIMDDIVHTEQKLDRLRALYDQTVRRMVEHLGSADYVANLIGQTPNDVMDAVDRANRANRHTVT